MARSDAYHHGNLKTALKDAVVELVQADGIGAVTMAEAARRTGVSPGAPYRHFDSLDALIDAAAAAAYQRFHDRQDRLFVAAESEDPEQLLVLWIRDFFDYASEEPGDFTLLFDSRIGQRSEVLHPYVLADFERALDLVSRAVDESPAECHDLTLNVSAIAFGHIKMHLDRFSPVTILADAPDLAEQGIRQVLAAHRAALPAGPGPTSRN